jgi:phage major head subunit gpT-like protein
MQTANPAQMAEFNRSINVRFKRGLGRIPPQYQELVTVERSTTSQTLYGFVKRITGLREWVGDRAAEDFATYDFAIKNRHFEKTLRVNRDHLDDDQFGFYGTQAEDLGDAAARHPDQLVATALEAGFTTLCSDGQYFFDTDHPTTGISGGQSNKGTAALSVSTYATQRAAMMALKDDGGEIMDIVPDLLIVPPALEETARNILQSNPIFVTGTPQNNIWAGTCRLLVLRRLTDTNNWYLADTSKVIRGIILQIRKDPELRQLISPTDENNFKRNELLYGVDWRGEVGYSLWQLMNGSIV